MEETALRDRVRAAEAEIANGRAERALAHCQALQARYPRALVVQRLLGEIYLAMNRPEEALAAMERVLAADPDDARACCARAIAHQMLGDRTAALTWYRRACEIRPEDNMLRQAYRELATPLGQQPYQMSSAALARQFLRGDLLLHADHEWRAVLAREPDRLDALVGLAEAQWRAGDAARAAHAARRALAQAPSCVRGLLILAAVEHWSGHETEARDLLRDAAALDPERRMGRALYGDLGGAEKDTLEAMLFAPGAETGTGVLGALPAMPALGGGQTGMFGVAPRSGSLPAATQEDLAAVSSLANSRAGALPEDFHSIFAETEFMLWGRDEDAASVPVIEAPAPVPDSSPLLGAELPVGDPLERARPSARRPDFGRPDGEDTESRAAVGWVQWLQALGARPLDPASATGRRPRIPTAPVPPAAGPTTGSLHGVFDALATPAAPPSWPGAPEPVGFPTGAPLPEPAGPGGFTGFAGLSDAPAASGDLPTAPAWDIPAADAGTGGFAWEVPGADDPPSAPVDSSPDAFGAPTWGAAAPNDPASGPAWGADGPARDWAAAGDGSDQRAPWEPAALAEAGAADGALPGVANQAADQSGEPVTLEALHDQFTASGFQDYAPRPGNLAALGGQAEQTDGAHGAPPPHYQPEYHPDPLDALRTLAGQTGADPADMDRGTVAPEASLAASAPDMAPAWARAQNETPPGAGTASSSGMEQDAAPVDGVTLAQARELRGRGQLEQALAVYAAVLREAPEATDAVIADLRAASAETGDAAAYRLLGDAYIHAGSYEQALEAYNQAQTRGQAGDA
jgi:tetratricopeptide (TPR) repeat protein